MKLTNATIVKVAKVLPGRFRSSSCLGALASGILILCASPALSADTYKVCFVDDRSGAVADTGNESFNGFTLAINDANDAGGVAGRKIEILSYDGKMDAQLTASFATRCAEDDGALLIVGGNPSGPAGSMIPVATQFNIPLYIMSAGQDNLTDPPAPFHFRFGPANHQDAVSIAELFASQGFKRVGIINHSAPFGADGAAASTTALEKQGVKVIVQQTYELNAVDVSPQVINLKDAKPEGVLVYSYPGDGARVTRTMRQLGVKLPTVIARAGVLESMRKLAGDSMDGDLVITTVDMTRPEVVKFFEIYAAKYKAIQPSPYALMGYDAGKMAIQVLGDPAVQKAIADGKLLDARKAIRDATEKAGQFKGLQGKAGASYQFSATRHQGPPDTGWFVFTEVTEKGTRLVPPDLGKFKPQH